PARKDELQRSDRERVEASSDDHQLSVRPQSVHQRRNRFRIWRSSKNYVGSAQRLKCRGWRASVGVDIVVSAQFLDHRFFVTAAANRGGAESHLACVLN